MPRSFSENQKQRIRNNLINTCKCSWTQYGYKKTSIDELCRQAGISKGAFYLFFTSKESLFCEVLCSVQDGIYHMASETIKKYPDKTGIAEAIKFIYREYDRNNFLYQADRMDYITLTNKLSPEQSEKIARSEERNRQLFLEQPHLKKKVDDDTLISVIYSLIMNIQLKDVLTAEHTAVLDFMVEHLIEDLYE